MRRHTPSRRALQCLSVGTAGTIAMASPPTLILHLDLNKTLLVSDPAGGKDLDDVIADLLASSAWGVVSDDRRSWTLVAAPSPVLSVDPPVHPPGCISYRDFAKHVLFPYRADAAHNATQKACINSLMKGFSAADGPGSAFHALHAAIRAVLTLSERERTACGDAQRHPRLAGLATGCHFLLPSYFRLLEYLAAGGRRFKLVFRTFGSDVLEVIEEHNAFVAGRHPLYTTTPAVLALAPRLTLRMPHDTGCFHRGAHGSLVLALVDSHGMVTTQAGIPAAFTALAAMDGGLAMGVRDCYPYWWQCHEHSDGGKVFPIDPADAHTHQIFCDDNIANPSDAVRLLGAAPTISPCRIDGQHVVFSAAAAQPDGRGWRHDGVVRMATTSAAASLSTWTPNDALPERDARIVDARDAASGAPLPFSSTRNVFTVRVDTLSAILNPDYFVEVVARCERNRGATSVAAV